jgi:hypothetical protein
LVVEATGKSPPRSISVGDAGAGVVDDLPVRVRAALEADADAVDDGAQGQRRGQSSGRAHKAEEAHAGGLQRGQRQAVYVGEAAEPISVAAPAGPAGADRSSATASAVAALVMPAPHEVERLVVASVGVEVVPTAVRGMPLALTVVLVEGAQVAMRLTPKCGCSGKSRPEGRMTSSQALPARSRA